jgi:hypothetical protein
MEPGMGGGRSRDTLETPPSSTFGSPMFSSSPPTTSSDRLRSQSTSESNSAGSLPKDGQHSLPPAFIPPPPAAFSPVRSSSDLPPQLHRAPSSTQYLLSSPPSQPTSPVHLVNISYPFDMSYVELRSPEAARAFKKKLDEHDRLASGTVKSSYVMDVREEGDGTKVFRIRFVLSSPFFSLCLDPYLKASFDL